MTPILPTRSLTFLRGSVALLVLSVVAACGGGSDSGGTPAATTPPPQGTQPVPADPVAPAPTLSGTAAVGAPIAGGAIAVQCAQGAVLNATTSDAGAWSVQTAGQTFPCIITLTGGNLDAALYPTGLHSFAVDATRANVTPVTELVMAMALGSDPAAWLAAQGTNVGAQLTQVAADLPAAKASLSNWLANAGYVLGDVDPLSGVFSPTAGDAYDDALEALSANLAQAGTSLADVVTSVAATEPGETPVALPGAYVISAADAAAMPQLNASTLSVADGTLTMAAPATAAQPIGAFVGGGTGNKAVLQFSGLNGMKLADLKSLEIVAQHLSGNTNLGPYFNFIVDLQCNMGLPGATIGDLRTRRVIGFSPGTASLYTADFSTGMTRLSITDKTPGWYIVGTPLLGVPASNSNNGNPLAGVDGFDFATYPNACIVDGPSGDAGLFRERTATGCDTGAALTAADPARCAKSHAGAILVMGDSVSVAARQWKVQSVSIAGRKYAFK